MRLLKMLFPLTLITIFSCAPDDSTDGDVTVSIVASGLSDDKLALNNEASFTSNVTGYVGDASNLTYKWILSTQRGELFDGTNALPNGTVWGKTIACVGKTEGDERIIVEVLDPSNNTIGTASYDFTIIIAEDGGITRGCFDQPKIIYLKGLSLYTCNFDGSEETYAGISGAYSANISPDGEQVAYIKYESNHPGGYTGYLMKLLRCDGSSGVIDIPYHNIANYPFWFQDSYPNFSPDSKTLYFQRPHPSSEPAVVNGGRPLELVAYDIQTEEVRFLTSLYQQNEQVRLFAVSPTTGEIAFIRRSFNDGNTDNVTLAIMQPETGFTQDLAALPSAGLHGMDWSSDGQDIIYSARNSDEAGIYRINVTSGSQPILLFSDPSTQSQPPLFPRYYANDTRIVWGGQENGTTSINLWTIDANGGDMRQLIDVPQTIFMEGVLD